MAALLAAMLPSAPGATLVPAPRPVASWDFGSSTPFIDTVNNYKLLQHDESRPVVILPTNGTFKRAAAFNWASHETWKDYNRATCGNRLYAPRASVPRLAAISGKDAAVTVLAWVQFSTGQNVQRGGAFVGGVWEEDQSWRQYAIFMDGTGGCKPKNGLVAHVSRGWPQPGTEILREPRVRLDLASLRRVALRRKFVRRHGYTRRGKWHPRRRCA